MTEKIYYSDPHISEFTATIESCTPKDGKWLLVLDRTAFFPEEGGQGADTGFIDNIPVEHVSIDKAGTISHLVGKEFAEGATVSGKINYEQRFDYEQQHSGEHILSGLAYSCFGCTNVGFHLGETETTLDFDKPLSAEQLRMLEQKANEAVLKNLPVKVGFPAPEELQKLEYRSKLALTENVRIVEIPGIDTCACCAPHVDSTGQICLIKIVRSQAWKGGVRLTIFCGQRALKNYTECLETLSKLTALCSTSAGLLPDSVNKMKNELAETTANVNRLQSELMLSEINSLPAIPFYAPLLFFTCETDGKVLRNTVNRLVSSRSGICAVFAGNDTTGYNFILGCAAGGCKEIAGRLRNELTAKCGGDDHMLQGNIPVPEYTIRAWFEA